MTIIVFTTARLFTVCTHKGKEENGSVENTDISDSPLNVTQLLNLHGYLRSLDTKARCERVSIKMHPMRARDPGLRPPPTLTTFLCNKVYSLSGLAALRDCKTSRAPSISRMVTAIGILERPAVQDDPLTCSAAQTHRAPLLKGSTNPVWPASLCAHIDRQRPTWRRG